VREPQPETKVQMVLDYDPEDERIRFRQSWAQMILQAMQTRPMYFGTVPAHVKARRRAKNRRARKARAVTRGDAR